MSLCPSLVVFYAKDAWSAGLILQNAWSLVGAGGNRIDALVALVGALALGAISKLAGFAIDTVATDCSD